MKRMILMLAFAAMLAQAAGAVVLHDQSAIDIWGSGKFNSVSGEPPMGMTSYAVCDITVDGDGWVIDTITTYYTANDFAWGAAITEGYLSVWPKTETVPTEDPATGVMVPMSAVMVEAWEVTAADLSIALEPGEYWICMTPIAPSGMWGPEFHLHTTGEILNDPSSAYDPFAFPGPPAWTQDTGSGLGDLGILVQGEYDVVGTESESWGSVKSLYR